MGHKMYVSVFDKLIWRTIGPKQLLIWYSTVLLMGQMEQLFMDYMYVVTNSINSLLISSCFKTYPDICKCTCIFIAHTKCRGGYMYTMYTYSTCRCINDSLTFKGNPTCILACTCTMYNVLIGLLPEHSIYNPIPN